MDDESVQKRQVGTVTVRELMQGFGSFRGESEVYKFKKESAAGAASDD